MEIHYYFIREKVIQGEIDLEHIKTEQQIADLLSRGCVTVVQHQHIFFSFTKSCSSYFVVVSCHFFI